MQKFSQQSWQQQNLGQKLCELAFAVIYARTRLRLRAPNQPICIICSGSEWSDAIYPNFLKLCGTSWNKGKNSTAFIKKEVATTTTNMRSARNFIVKFVKINESSTKRRTCLNATQNDENSPFEVRLTKRAIAMVGQVTHSSRS